MPRPQPRPSRFSHSLDMILGSKASVRIVRALALRETALAAGELARLAALGRTAIYPTLRQLERAGIVELLGAGGQKLVQLRAGHPLSRPLRELFASESTWLEELAAALRDLLSELPYRPMSVWLDETEGD